jgi:site-specific DNA-methyltransferase (adenine-specific)
MQQYPDNHFTSILTDPPYGLSFMNKAWDHSIPGKEFWIEALRVCKPGAMMLCFGGTRTYHRLTCAIEDAGWEIRDCLMWLYGSGFPKSHNKFGLEGYGTAFKPAYEPIILAMKSLDGTYAQNVEKWGLGGINIDGCRIGADQRINNPSANRDREKWRMNQGEGCKPCIGRWPSNLLFDEEAAELLDEQSGISKSKSGGMTFRNEGTKQLKGLGKTGRTGHDDSGGASRFFYCAKASSAERNRGCEGLPLKEGGIKNESGRGFSESDPHAKIMMHNNHPTVKPVVLLEYLLKLIAPPQNALILDPFAGSGSTCVAAKRLGLECVGIEISDEYCKIAQARIDSVKIDPQLDFFLP